MHTFIQCRVSLMSRGIRPFSTSPQLNQGPFPRPASSSQKLFLDSPSSCPEGNGVGCRCEQCLTTYRGHFLLLKKERNPDPPLQRSSSHRSCVLDTRRLSPLSRQTLGIHTYILVLDTTCHSALATVDILNISQRLQTLKIFALMNERMKE